MTRAKLHEIIFEADTKKGKIFDIILLIAILISVFGVILSSVDSIEKDYGNILRFSEWIFTILFTIEYIFRIYCIKKPIKYIFSFMGIIDFLSIIPTYLVFLYPPIHVLVDIRAIRLIRVFRVFKLSRYLRGANIMQIALKSSRPKIIVFLLSVVLIVIILGTLMYIVEGQKNGFENIPKSIYWSVVTLTTVGYGDVVPLTTTGKFLASIIMILGYGIIAVPTGIVSAAIAKSAGKITTQSCRVCSREGHDLDARHCKFCGASLNN
ncbi:MAG: ion transporter [Flavobacteriales bacterium]|nr:ion transporter [Flavobacteriales bacterium]